jgi:hypothetical protein
LLVLALPCVTEATKNRTGKLHRDDGDDVDRLDDHTGDEQEEEDEERDWDGDWGGGAAAYDPRNYRRFRLVVGGRVLVRSLFEYRAGVLEGLGRRQQPVWRLVQQSHCHPN